MPYKYEWVPNEVFLDHNGILIFHTYKHDEDIIHTYWYGTASDTRDEDDDTNFDVRDLPGWKSNNSLTDHEVTGSEEEAIRATIIAALDRGDLNTYIEAAANRPKEHAIHETMAVCLISLRSDNGSWKMLIDFTSNDTTVHIPISTEQKERLVDAGLAE